MEYLCENCWNYPCASDKTKKITGCFAYRTKHTNADKLRDMSDEELAEFFTPFYYDGPKFYCPAQADVGEGECAAKSDCRQCWLDWLQKEAQDA